MGPKDTIPALYLPPRNTGVDMVSGSSAAIMIPRRV